ncbi:LOW QUALITY PROTEIN: hypothetical protein OSB04_011614 [Centaurea solstitialis]|uniref:Reverse transcriptase zinc-binding domain-containing protein n=1 Tax=Centaurea solstitialis TaxID=347529 RepID=A0AA38WLN6_9ASTR|nr:LOW QUALITY PROTEIN: hypothetical protein OSB04_011614 [Centaurea solstitialis]
MLRGGRYLHPRKLRHGGRWIRMGGHQAGNPTLWRTWCGWRPVVRDRRGGSGRKVWRSKWRAIIEESWRKRPKIYAGDLKTGINLKSVYLGMMCVDRKKRVGLVLKDCQCGIELCHTYMGYSKEEEIIMVSWIYIHRLHNVHFWSAPYISNSSWIWLIGITRRSGAFFPILYRDGLTSNAWEDRWLTVGSLSSILPYQIFHGQGFTMRLLRLFHRFNPLGRRYGLIDVPCLRMCHYLICNLESKIVFSWLNLLQEVRSFSVSEVWRTFSGNHETVAWYELCWFKNHVPKHSFCFWLAILDRLPTRQRKCGRQMGILSYSHLFFQCTYSNSVWMLIRDDIGCSLDGVWNPIILELSHRRWHPGENHKKRLFVGLIYYIWQERNRRLFDTRRRDPPQLIKELKVFMELRSGGGSHGGGAILGESSISYVTT